MSGMMRFDTVMRLARLARTARDLMTTNPVSLNEKVTVAEAAAFLTGRDISAAPVINEAGRPVGVVSQADIVRQTARKPELLQSMAAFEAFSEDSFLDEVFDRRSLLNRRRDPDEPIVSDVMTPRVHCVTPDTPLVRIVEELLANRVHRLFVIDDDGVLIGVITALDILRSLRR